LTIEEAAGFSRLFFFLSANICLSVSSGEDCRALKFTLSHYLGVWRSAPPGRRFHLTRKVADLVRRMPESAPARYFDIGEFKSFEQFEIKYRQLADELGHPGKIPAAGEMDFLHAMVDLDPVRYPGGIGSRDYFFLTALISILAPRRVVEIGTLTGFSTAIIAAAIYRQHGNDSEVTVDTIDSHTHCSIDETRLIGFEIPELIPDLASTVRIHTGRESDLVRELAAHNEFGLAFIDADHRHPWPLLDVLRLAPYIKKGGWILLHDIQLGTYGKAERDAGNKFQSGTPYGAEWLFDRWPFRKIRSFHIGAIELPSRQEELIPFALDLMEEPFEITGKAVNRLRRAIYESFAELV
jgi:predicted O-methyltransferase YrrM